MDCNYNFNRYRMPMPAYPNTDIMPDMMKCPMMESMPMNSMNSQMDANTLDERQNRPLSMAYVPWQKWEQTYPEEQGLKRGTIFPDLDFPFMMGGCR